MKINSISAYLSIIHVITTTSTHVMERDGVDLILNGLRDDLLGLD